MKNKIQQLKTEFLEKLNEIQSPEFLKDLENKYLGRKGELTELFKSIKDLSVDARAEIGQIANDARAEINTKLTELKGHFMTSGDSVAYDISLPGKTIEVGHLHPITLIMREMVNAFKDLGFIIVEGPELEKDYYNFETLNIPKNHPARDMQDTFYIDQKNSDGEYDLVLRTHTSPVQIRAMKKYGAPIKMIAPGRVFRNEATDVRHEHTFYQIEGMMIDKKINFAHMKGILEAVGQRVFGSETKLRMRPKFYPFVEPGSNGEYTCATCKGKGCRLCKNSGWLEIIGCGLIHPEVLRNGGIDPEIYTGFAFGFGLNRLAMIKYGISDGRDFCANDFNFLKQF